MLTEFFLNLSPMARAGVIISAWAFALVGIPILIHKINKKLE
jgi:hypothetical protein